MLKYALLASGSKGNCCIIKDEETSIIIDCGSTKTYLNKCFSALHYNVDNTDALLITHTHSDHVSQLKMFNDIDTYASCLLDTDNFHVLDSYAQIKINTMKIQVLPTSHDSFESCGYLIESHDKKLVYITDTGYVKDEVKELIKNADYYIFESNHDVEMLMETNRPMFTKQRIISDQGHLCNEDCAEVLNEVIGDNTSEIVLAHISEQGNTKAKAKEVVEETLKENHNLNNIKIIAAPQFDVVIGGSKND